MARTLSIAIPHPAGFALLQPASRPRLDATRIATLSGTLAVNLLAIGLLMMPLRLPPAAPLADVAPQMQMDWLSRSKVTPPAVPLPVEIKRMPTPSVAPTARPQVPAPVSTSPVATALSETAGEPATAVGEHTDKPTVAPATSGPMPVQLQYAHAPAPTYPRGALRSGATGTVLLQVLVGVDGRPLQVTVAQGSGHRELDSAARNQVLRHWRFRPAMADGRAVPAIGLVPVEFALD